MLFMNDRTMPHNTVQNTRATLTTMRESAQEKWGEEKKEPLVHLAFVDEFR